MPVLNNNRIAERALGKINRRMEDRLRRMKGHSWNFVATGIPANAFEAMCVLYREYRLEDLEDAGRFIRKLKLALQEEYEKLSDVEKTALDEKRSDDEQHTEYKPYLDYVYGEDIMVQYLFSEFEQYIHDFESDRIRAAYGKWLGADWGPLPGSVPEETEF